MIDNEKPNFVGTSTRGSSPYHYSSTIKVEPIKWPSRQEVKDQIQQLKTSARPQVNSVISSPYHFTRPRVNARTIPAPISNVLVRHTPIQGTNQHRVTVSFTHNPQDSYFQAASIYLKQGGREPVLVGGGTKSPLTFTTNKTTEASTVIVQSAGNWGSTLPHQSPSKQVRLG